MRERFVELYRERYSLILTTIEHRVNTLQGAEDLTEQVFTLAWQRMSEGEAVDLRWLHATARNVVGNEYQRRQRYTSLVQRAGENLEPAPLPDDNDLTTEVRRRVRGLEESDRELIYMAYWEGLTGDEIASVLGCSPAAARKRLQRARRAAGIALGDLRGREGALYDRVG